MSAVTLIPAAITGLAFITGTVLEKLRNRGELKNCAAAIIDLRDRLATITGQLADERARYALRINRAHEGACKAAKTRAAMRINLDQQRTAVQDLPEGGRV